MMMFVFAGCDFDVSPPPADEPVEAPKLTYETVEFDEETDSYIIDIEYPQFSNAENVNEVIKEKVMNGIDMFHEEIDIMELNPEDLGEFFIGKNGYYVMYDVSLYTDDIISIAFYESVYWSGAAHPMSYTETFNYDVKENRELGLLDFFVPDTLFWEAISSVVVPKIKQKLYEDEFVEDEWIDDGAGPEPENFHQFTLTEDGFVFHFDPYVVAAYAAGPQRIEVPFSELYAILLPPWNGEPAN